jgi:hypothetical protein
MSGQHVAKHLLCIVNEGTEQSIEQSAGRAQTETEVRRRERPPRLQTCHNRPVCSPRHRCRRRRPGPARPVPHVHRAFSFLLLLPAPTPARLLAGLERPLVLSSDLPAVDPHNRALHFHPQWSGRPSSVHSLIRPLLALFRLPSTIRPRVVSNTVMLDGMLHRARSRTHLS